MKITEPLEMNIGNTYKVIISWWNEDEEVREEFTDKLIKRDFNAEKYKDYRKYALTHKDMDCPEYYCFTYYFENHEPVYSDDIENTILIKKVKWGV